MYRNRLADPLGELTAIARQTSYLDLLGPLASGRGRDERGRKVRGEEQNREGSKRGKVKRGLLTPPSTGIIGSAFYVIARLQTFGDGYQQTELNQTLANDKQ